MITWNLEQVKLYSLWRLIRTLPGKEPKIGSKNLHRAFCEERGIGLTLKKFSPLDWKGARRCNQSPQLILLGVWDLIQIYHKSDKPINKLNLVRYARMLFTGQISCLKLKFCNLDSKSSYAWFKDWPFSKYTAFRETSGISPKFPLTRSVKFQCKNGCWRSVHARDYSWCYFMSCAEEVVQRKQDLQELYMVWCKPFSHLQVSKNKTSVQQDLMQGWCIDIPGPQFVFSFFYNIRAYT